MKWGKFRGDVMQFIRICRLNVWKQNVLLHVSKAKQKQLFHQNIELDTTRERCYQWSENLRSRSDRSRNAMHTKLEVSKN